MRSHFLPQKVTAACAVAGATTLLSGTAPAQNFVAADYATNPTYTSGWSAGQNGGYGFGPWSFDSTITGTNSTPDAGYQQTTSIAAAIGMSWTLFDLTNNGISDVGRTINGTNGLQPGQTFETVIQNPTAYAYYRGFDILFYNGTTNLPAGDNTAALRMLVFNYYTTHWKAVDDSGTTFVPLTSADTGAAGMKFDLTLLTTNTYSLTMTPLGNPANAYSQTGTLKAILPINWVNYRLWGNQSTGSNDIADNFEISSMTVGGLTLNIQQAGTNAVLSWLNIPGYFLESASGLAPANWHSNSISPVTINGENFVTNSIAGYQQFFRLQLQQ